MRKKVLVMMLGVTLLVSGAGCSNSVEAGEQEAGKNFEVVLGETVEQKNVETLEQTEGEKVEEKIAETVEYKFGEAEYSSKIFDQSYVHEINIEISDEDWADLRKNPLEKIKYKVNVIIDGEVINNVSFATKGNTSLSSVAGDPNSDRYSFKINFGKYEKGQTYYGLDKLNLNNIYADSTYMKDYISYEIFRAVGIDATSTSYVNLKINGEDFGLYLALEEVGESYLERTGNEEGELYKPETAMLGNMGSRENRVNIGNIGDRGNWGDFGNIDIQNGSRPNGQGNTNREWPNIQNNQNGEWPAMPGNQNGEWPAMPGNQNGEWPAMPGNQNGEWPTMPGQNEDGFVNAFQFGDREGNRGGFGGGFGGSSSGASLKYTDDDLESYSDIFDNDETGADDEAKMRVVAALKALSEGKVEEAIEVAEVINYFVAHNFVLNYDSYTGNMLHNYYLMESDGKLSMLPWDYNLAFGAFSQTGMGGSSNVTALINTGIDSPLFGANEEDRPFWNFIVSNEEYLNQYHESCQRLIDYINSGKLEDEINRVSEMIKPYVEKDKTAFYSASEFEKGYATLIEFCELRAESIEKQLSGALSKVTSEQDKMAMVDASSLNIKDMGSQGKGRMNR